MTDLKARLTAWYARQFISYAEAKTKWSVWWNSALVTVGTVWILLPDEVQSKIVEAVLSSFGVPTSWAIVGVALIGLYLRLKKQKPAEPATDSAVRADQ